MASRTAMLGAVAVVAAAAGAYGFLYMQDDAPPPKVAAVPAKPAVAMPAKSDAAPSPTAAPGGAPAPGEDKLAALDRQIKATQSKVGELEKTVGDLQSQIAAKNKEIAELEKKLAKK